jgi:hypothetical protein
MLGVADIDMLGVALGVTETVIEGVTDIEGVAEMDTLGVTENEGVTDGDGVGLIGTMYLKLLFCPQGSIFSKTIYSAASGTDTT